MRLLSCRHVWVWNGGLLSAAAGVEMGDWAGLSLANVRVPAVPG